MTTIEEIARNKIKNILEQYIIYLYDNFNPLTIKPFREGHNDYRYNTEIRHLIRDDNVVFTNYERTIVGLWNNETNSIMEIPNYFVDTIQYLQFNLEYIIQRPIKGFKYSSNEEIEYLKYIINTEFNINDDVYIYIQTILNEWRGGFENDNEYFENDEQNLVRRLEFNILQYLTRLSLSLTHRADMIIMINNILHDLNSYTPLLK